MGLQNTNARDDTTMRCFFSDWCVWFFVKYLQDGFTKIQTHTMTRRCAGLRASSSKRRASGQPGAVPVSKGHLASTNVAFCRFETASCCSPMRRSSWLVAVVESIQHRRPTIAEQSTRRSRSPSGVWLCFATRVTHGF